MLCFDLKDWRIFRHVINTLEVLWQKNPEAENSSQNDDCELRDGSWQYGLVWVSPKESGVSTELWAEAPQRVTYDILVIFEVDEVDFEKYLDVLPIVNVKSKYYVQ